MNYCIVWQEDNGDGSADIVAMMIKSDGSFHSRAVEYGYDNLLDKPCVAWTGMSDARYFVAYAKSSESGGSIISGRHISLNAPVWPDGLSVPIINYDGNPEVTTVYGDNGHVGIVWDNPTTANGYGDDLYYRDWYPDSGCPDMNNDEIIDIFDIVAIASRIRVTREYCRVQRGTVIKMGLLTLST